MLGGSQGADDPSSSAPTSGGGFWGSGKAWGGRGEAGLLLLLAARRGQLRPLGARAGVHEGLEAVRVFLGLKQALALEHLVLVAAERAGGKGWRDCLLAIIFLVSASFFRALRHELKADPATAVRYSAV